MSLAAFATPPRRPRHSSRVSHIAPTPSQTSYLGTRRVLNTVNTPTSTSAFLFYFHRHSEPQHSPPAIRCDIQSSMGGLNEVPV